MLWHIAPSLSCPSDGDRAAAAAATRKSCLRRVSATHLSLLFLLLFSSPEEKYASSSSSVSPPPGLRPKREKGEKDAATDGWRGVSERGKQHGRKGEKAWPREKGPDVSIWGGRRGTSHCSGPHPLLSPTPNPFFHSGRWPRWKKRREGRGEVSTPLFPHLFFRLALSLFF